MISHEEPICALISPPGTAAINVIRVSGKGSIGIVAQFFQPHANLLKSPSHRAHLGTFHALDGQPLDQVLCTVFRSPHSYTGEDSVEISCHGNPQLSAQILENLLTEARLAQRGEFTLRALLNGKLDLAQAEAVNDLISAKGSRAESAAFLQMQGGLSLHLQSILDSITDARLRCELAIDFVDQDLPPMDLTDMEQRLQTVISEARALRSEGEQGRYVREGIRVCLAGLPNSGKSSLFNAILKSNRAIVTPHPGTTRDYLEESIVLEGYNVILTDTAGIRDSHDPAEKEGVQRSKDQAFKADLLLWLTPVNEPPSQGMELDIPAGSSFEIIWLASKADLAPVELFTNKKPSERDGKTASTPLPVSVFSENGLGELYSAILDRLKLPRNDSHSPLITNARHLAALDKCILSLERGLLALQHGSGFEFAAFDLKAASTALEEILGIVTTDDLLDRIFSGFCIGK
jgi:tRNA modification GTPase